MNIIMAAMCEPQKVAVNQLFNSCFVMMSSAEDGHDNIADLQHLKRSVQIDSNCHTVAVGDEPRAATGLREI